MTIIRGFDIPEDLYYWIEKHLWVRPVGEGLFRLGLTPVAYHLLHHSLEAISIKRSVLGMEVPRGKSVAMVESLKYIGGVPAPFACIVVLGNEVLASAPDEAERDPYGAGWIAEVRSVGQAAERDLLTGEPAITAYRILIEAQNIG
jgi:glycine cleavage system H protein